MRELVCVSVCVCIICNIIKSDKTAASENENPIENIWACCQIICLELIWAMTYAAGCFMLHTKMATKYKIRETLSLVFFRVFPLISFSFYFLMHLYLYSLVTFILVIVCKCVHFEMPKLVSDHI